MDQTADETVDFKEIRIVEIDESHTQPDKQRPEMFRFPWRLSSNPPERWVEIFRDEWSRWRHTVGHPGRKGDSRRPIHLRGLPGRGICELRRADG